MKKFNGFLYHLLGPFRRKDLPGLQQMIEEEKVWFEEDMPQFLKEQQEYAEYLVKTAAKLSRGNITWGEMLLFERRVTNHYKKYVRGGRLK